MNRIFITHRAVSVSEWDNGTSILCACGMMRNDDTSMMNHISSANTAMEKEIDKYEELRDAEMRQREQDVMASLGFRSPVQH